MGLIFRRRLWLAALDRDQAQLSGQNPLLSKLLTLGLIGAVCGFTVPVIGPEAILALLLIPPAILQRATPSMALYGPLCSVVGIVGAAGSFVLTVDRDWPAAPSLILSLIASSIFALLILLPCRALLSRRRSTAQAPRTNA